MEASHEFCFALRQVKRHAVGLCDRGCEVYQEAHGLHEDIPVRKERIDAAQVPGPALVFDDLAQAQRAREHQDSDHRETQGQLVADHLGRRAEPAEQRVLAVRRPSRQRDAVNAERGHRKNEQQTYVQIGDLKKLMPVERVGLAEGDD